MGWLNLVARDAETAEEIYAFYHPTFQEYFAALAVEDNWHFFLNHIPENPQHPDAQYRIFEKQWKEVILLWLGREEVEKEEKEAFIEALVEFDDGCGEFYKYRAYFLAAAGIAEFTACSRADEIVSQIIKWGFAYFNEEKQKGRTFIEPIAERSREILKETDRERAISTLVELINTPQNGYTWWHAAKSLGIIGQNNPVAISALVEFIGTCENELIRRQAAKSLGIISPNNPVAIEFITESLQGVPSAEILEKIDNNTGVSLAILFEFIGTLDDEFMRFLATGRLGIMVEKNPVFICTLVEAIGTFQDEYRRMQAAQSLGKIGKYNPVALSALVDLIGKSGDEDTRRLAAEILGHINEDNPVAIAALVDLINTSQDESTRRQAAYSLGVIDKNNPVAIASLVKLINTSQNEDTRRQAAESLGKIDKDNPVAIASLVKLIRNSGDEDTRRQAADSLGAIDKDNPVAISALVELIGTSQDYNNQRQAAYSLEKICQDNPVAIVAPSGLKDCLTSEIYENDFNRYEICYQVIWNCAQNMTYPDFYQAWHTQPTSSPIPDRNHPQNTDIPTLLKQLQPTDQTLPVPLNIRALEGETDTSAIAQEFCTQLYQAIFPADTDIPAIRNAPEFKRLIPQLKNRLQKQHIALILHSCPCEDALSSLGHKLADTQMGIHIAWITDTPLELPLTGFPPNQDDLLNAVQNWIGEIGSRSRGRT